MINLEPSIIQNVVKNFKKISATEKVQQATLAFIVYNLISKEETEILRKCFLYFDNNDDGHLDREEIRSRKRS